MPFLIRGAIIGVAIWLSAASVAFAALLVTSWRRRPVRYVHSRCPMCNGKGVYFVDELHHPSALDECPMCDAEGSVIVRADD